MFAMKYKNEDVSWKDMITKVEIRAMDDKEHRTEEQRLHWLGHVIEMDHQQRTAQQALYWEV